MLSELIKEIIQINKECRMMRSDLYSLMSSACFQDIKILYNQNQNLFYKALEVLNRIESLLPESGREKAYFEALNNYVNSLIKQVKSHARVTYHIWQQDINPRDYAFHSENLKKDYSIYCSNENESYAKLNIVRSYR